LRHSRYLRRDKPAEIVFFLSVHMAVVVKPHDAVKIPVFMARAMGRCRNHGRAAVEVICMAATEAVPELVADAGNVVSQLAPCQVKVNPRFVNAKTRLRGLARKGAVSRFYLYFPATARTAAVRIE